MTTRLPSPERGRLDRNPNPELGIQETSLHPDLITPLARLIVDAAELSQVWVSTHSTELAKTIQALSGVEPTILELSEGETFIRQ